MFGLRMVNGSMSERNDPQVERLQRLNAVLRHRSEKNERFVEEINELVRRFAALDERTDRLVMGRVVRVAAFNDPSLDDTGLIWIPALKVPDGLGMVLVEMNEYAHLLCDAVPLELRCGQQFLAYSECTPQMRTAVVAQTLGLLDRLLAAVATGES
jgi:hypothetical protein